MEIQNPFTIGTNEVTDAMVQALGRVFLSVATGTFTVPKTGNYLLLMKGGGGGGGGGTGLPAAAATGGRGGTGGGEGGYHVEIVALVAGTVYNYSIGAGGVGGAGVGNGQGFDGNPGTNSVFNVTSTAAGGYGGTCIWDRNAVNTGGMPGWAGHGPLGGTGGPIQAANADGNPGTNAGGTSGSGGGGGGGGGSGALAVAGGTGGAGSSGYIILIW